VHARNVKFTNVNVNGFAKESYNWAYGGVYVQGFTSVSFKKLVVSNTQANAVLVYHSKNNGVKFQDCRFVKNCATLSADPMHSAKFGVITYYADRSTNSKALYTRNLLFDKVKIEKANPNADAVAYFSSMMDASKVYGIGKISYKRVTISGRISGHIKYSAYSKKQFSPKSITYSCWKQGKKVLKTLVSANTAKVQKVRKC